MSEHKKKGSNSEIDSIIRVEPRKRTSHSRTIRRVTRFVLCRQISKDGSKHSLEAKDLLREFCEVLLGLHDGCAETFPFWTIQELYEDYFSNEEIPDMYDR